MPKPPPSPLLRYGVVCLAVAGAMLLRWPLWSALGPKMPFLFLWPVVLFCAWYSGVGAGLLATMVSALAAIYFLDGGDSPSVIDRAEWTGMILFVVAGIISSIWAAWLSHARHRVVSQGEWLRVTLSSIGDAVIATDSRGRITFFNPVASQLTGWDQDEAIGKLLEAVFQIVHEKTRHAIENPVMQVLVQDTTVTLPNSTILVAKDGTERPIEDSAAPIRDDAGEVIGAVLVFHDISRRRQMEKELRHKTEQLAEVDHHKERFLAILAKEQLRRERLDLADLVRRTAEGRRSALAEAGLVLALDLPKTPVWMTGDPQRLAQVILTLLAAESSGRKGAVPLLVQLAADANRRQALLTITHAGMEIATDELPCLFDVLARADSSSSQAPGGSRLGLALARELVELYGGEVRAVGEGPGRGTKFLVRLPLEEEPIAVAAVPAATHPSGMSMRILVVEDNQDSAESMRLLLRTLGHEVAVVRNGAEAVTLASAWRPQIVFSDIGMPGMNGYELAAALRRNPATAKAHLIAVTGLGQEEDRRRCQEAGFDHLLVKPVDPHVLQSMVALQMLVPHLEQTAAAGPRRL